MTLKTPTNMEDMTLKTPANMEDIGNLGVASWQLLALTRIKVEALKGTKIRSFCASKAGLPLNALVVLLANHWRNQRSWIQSFFVYGEFFGIIEATIL
jgi:hypothetical protein